MRCEFVKQCVICNKVTYRKVIDEDHFCMLRDDTGLKATYDMPVARVTLDTRCEEHPLALQVAT